MFVHDVSINMKMITALTAQKKNHDRVNVFLDGAFAFGLPFAVAAKLKIGQSLAPEDVVALQLQDVRDKAKNTAIGLISYRPRSVAEVRRHLDRKGYDAELVTAVTDHLQAVELLNDEVFARYWVEQREAFKPRSQLALRQELQQKGVSRDIIDTVLAGLDETAAARRAAEKRARIWANLPADAFRLKLGQFLQRRGFRYEIIKQVTDELWQSMASERSKDDDAIL